MTTKAAAWLHVFFAQQNDRAVILRQGPCRLFRMILWHRDTDRFEDGQWLRHKIYADRCDLSPDARHFPFFALDGKWGRAARGSSTGISRPPCFTARVLHPQGDARGGGGTFLSNTEYAVDGCAADDIPGCEPHLRHVPRGAPSLLKLRIPEWRTWLERKAKSIADAGYHVDGARLLRRHDDSLMRDFNDICFAPIKARFAQARRRPSDNVGKTQ